MNFLAHMYLSFNEEQIVIGNFIADFVKGRQIEGFPKDVRKGILLHREIDSFTDSHEIVKESKKRLVKSYRHYASVIIDIYYDHFLAKHWSDYASEKLQDFTTRNYTLLERFSPNMPPKCAYVLKHMKATDWLYNYQHLEGIEMALTGMARRTKFDSGMENSVDDLKHDYVLYYKEFKAFFVEVENHARQHLEFLNSYD